MQTIMKLCLVLLLIICITTAGKTNAKKYKQKKELKEKLENEARNLGKECAKVGGSEATQRNCRLSKTMEEMNKLKGGTATKNQAQELLLEAGLEEAAAVIKNCTDAAAPSAKKDCFTSEAAKTACKNILGSECSNSDLMRGVKEQATKSIQGKLQACTEAASTPAQKAVCRKNKLKDFRKEIATAEAKNEDDLKDSDVIDFIQKGAKRAIKEAMALCNSTAASDRKRCAKDAKEAMANSMGKSKNDITDFEFERYAKEAKEGKVADAMKACIELAGSDKGKKKNCVEVEAKKAMKENSLDGKEPSAAKVKAFLKDASKEAVKQAKKACTDTKSNACAENAKRVIAESLGKDVNDLKTFEVNDIERKAAIASALESARNCYQARKDNSSATCKDLFNAYNDVKGTTAPSDQKKKKTAMEKVFAETLKDAAKEARKVCLEKESKNEVATCLTEAKNDEDEVSKILYPGKSSDERKKKQDLARKEANVEVLGSEFSECMKLAGSDKAKKQQCMDDLKSMKDKLGSSEKAVTILRRARTNLLLDPAESCDAADLKQCREDAKEEAKNSGMPITEYALTKKLAEIKGAAKEWASCSEGGFTDTECNTVAKDKFIAISGSNADAYDKKTTPDAKQTVKERVQKIGKAIKDGVETKLYEKKKLVVTIETSGAKCDENVKSQIKTKIESLRKASDATTEQKKMKGVAPPNCRVVDNKAEYTTAVDTKDLTGSDKYDKLASDTSNKLAGESYKPARRRLLLSDVSTTNSYAAQDVTECAEDDSACQTDSTITESDTSTVGEGSTSGTLSSMGVNLISLLVPAFMILCLMSF